MVKYQLFCYKLVDHEIKKITNFNLIRLHLQKKDNFGDVHRRPPTQYFTVKSEHEMDLASAIAMNFI